MKSPTVSIVIPTFNRAPLLPRSIASALREMVPGDELIVVDDGSTDDTAAVVSRFGDAVRYVRTANGGAGHARNRGVAEATGDLVAFLDADDEYLPGRLELPRRILAARPDLLFTFSDMVGRTSDGDVEHFVLRHWHEDPRSWGEILAPGVPYSALATLPPATEDFGVYMGSLYAGLARAPYATIITMTVRRSAAGDALRFDEDWPLYEDWGCMARLARTGPAAYLEIETARQHGHRGPRLTAANVLVHASTRVALLERIWGCDRTYLKEHASEYRELIEYFRTAKARQLFIAGRRAEAAREVAMLAAPSPLFRLLARVPGHVTLALVRLIRPFRERFRHWKFSGEAVQSIDLPPVHRPHAGGLKG